MGERESRVKASRSPIFIAALGALALGAGSSSSQEVVRQLLPILEVVEVAPEFRDAIERSGCKALHGVGAESVGGLEVGESLVTASLCDSHGSASGFPRHYLVGCTRTERGWNCLRRGELIAAQLGGEPVDLFIEGDVADVAFAAAKFAVENQHVKPETRLEVWRAGARWVDQLYVKRAGPHLLKFLDGTKWVYIEYASSGAGTRFKHVEPPAEPVLAQPADEEERDQLRERTLRYLQLGGPDDWHKVAKGWSFNSDAWALTWVIRQAECDRGTALLIYWRAAPGWYQQYGGRGEVRKLDSVEMFDLLREIERRFLSGSYTRQEIAFDPRNDDGMDRTKFYVDVTVKHPIPRELYAPTTGRKITATCVFFPEETRCFDDEAP